MKKNMMNKLKKVMATVMMACMLLTVVRASSDAGIMPCGAYISGEVPEIG